MGSLVGLMYHFFRVKIITLLAEKRVHPNFSVPGINEVDIYQFDPSDLPTLSETNSDDQVWYFFVEPYYKYAKSKRVHRATGGGYWKITGKGCDVKDKGQVIGSKKTLVFCRRGATSKETETDWVMHEFYVKDSPQYEVESRQPMGQHFISDSRQHISESSFLQVRKIMPYRLSSVSVIVFEKHIHTTNALFVYDAFLQVETPPLSSNNLVSGPIIPFLESSSGVELQLLSSYELDYHLRNHFMPSSSSLMYPQQPDEIEEVSYYNWLNQSLDPALQLPNNPHQGFNTSYANGISNNCNMECYQFTGGLEDVVNLQRNVQN